MLFTHRPAMSDSPSLLCLSPSLNSLNSTRFNEIAARVIRELRNDDVPEDEDFLYSNDDDGDDDNNNSSSSSSNSNSSNSSDKPFDPEEEEVEEEFEFSFSCKEPATSPVSADEIFLNGKIKPLYSIPVVLKKKTEKRMPLRMLFTEEKDSSLSCSSSEADDLEALPPGTYCVWKPKTTSSTEDSCKKSKSTGTSRRWRLRNLLHRSNSDGKDTFVFFTRKEKENGDHHHDHHHDRDKNQRRPLDLVGVFSNVNGLSRNLRPF